MTDRPHKPDVVRAFDGARRYDEAADVQRAVATALAGQIAEAAVPPFESILELGCGTGFLTKAMMRSLPVAPRRWIISDVAPAMVERARAGGPRDADYHVLDGEAIDSTLGRFDLICASLAFQWFADLPRAAAAMQARLNPGGLLAFAMMAQGSFDEWRAAHVAEGLSPGTPDYPDAAALRALAGRRTQASVEIVNVPQPEADARAFLHRLKAIGAGTPRSGHVPLDAGRLRRVMAHFDAGDRVVTYRIAFCLFRAPGGR